MVVRPNVRARRRCDDGIGLLLVAPDDRVVAFIADGDVLALGSVVVHLEVSRDGPVKVGIREDEINDASACGALIGQDAPSSDAYSAGLKTNYKNTKNNKQRK